MLLTEWKKRYNVPLNKTLKNKTIKYANSRNWYNNSYAAIQKRYKSHTSLFIKLLAVTSPRTTVKRNLYLADKTLRYIIQNKPIDFSYGITNKTTRKNVDRVINNKPIHGPKVKAFAAALNSDSSQIVIDSWMLKVFNINRSAPTQDDRVHIKTIINKLSNQLNLTPAETQACLWSYTKNELNDTPFKEDNDFSEYLKQSKIEDW